MRRASLAVALVPLFLAGCIKVYYWAGPYEGELPPAPAATETPAPTPTP